MATGQKPIEKTISGATLEHVSLDRARIAAYRAELAKTDIPAKEHVLLAKLLAFYDVPVKDTANFLNPTEKASLPKPFALLDMKPATDLLIDAVKDKRKIAVWADYDADGNTSAAMLGHIFEEMGADDTTLTIPFRSEGFGLNIPGIKKLHDEGAEVLVVADSGTVAHEQIAYARKLGMDVVVLDHHQPRPGEELPDALVVNPNRNDDPSPHGALAAASVSYVFARDLVENLKARGEKDLADKIDFDRLRAISAIGVVADVVGLNDPANRYIVKEGLKQINSRKYPGLNVLKDLYGDRLNRDELTAEDLAFTLGPGINAAGRLGDPKLGMQLLMCKTEEEAAPLAKKIKAVNEERKIITEQVFEEAEKAAEAYLQANPDAHFIMVQDEKWHAGVVGIVAGRLKEKYGLPAAVGHVYTADNGQKNATYSVRSAEGVNFFSDAVVPIEKEHVAGVHKIGGHAMAAGMTLSLSEADNVRDYIDRALAPAVKQAREHKTIRYLDKLPLSTLQSGAFQNAYERMEPFGQLMRRPLYLAEGVQVKGIRRVGKDNEHLQFSIGKAGAQHAQAEAVRGGVLFRGLGTTVGDALTSPTRRDEKMDMVVDPFIKKHKGETQIGFLPVDVANVERLNELAPQEELASQSDALFEHRREAQQKLNDHVYNQPRKIEHLKDENNKEAQAALKTLAQTKVAVLDTETTGLDAGADTASKANGLTQVAMLTAYERTNNGQPNGKYAAREYNQPILPLSPAHFGWKQAAAQGKAPAYDRDIHEYTITSDALAVTGTKFTRDDIRGPIKDMYVGPVKLDAKPFYEVAPKLADLLMTYLPAAYNAPFDMPVLSRHFADLLDARPDHPEPRLAIAPEAWQQWQEQVREPLQKAFKVPAELRDKPGMEQLPESLTNPAEHVCLMHAAMVHKGFSTQQRLQHIAPTQYGVAFTQDDTAHDALSDVGPLVYLLADQFKDFGKVPTMGDLWQALVQKAAKSGTAQTQENGDIVVKLGKDAKALLPFFESFKDIGERNPRAKAYVGIRSISGDTVVLMGREKETDADLAGSRRKKTFYKQPRHIGLLKKTLTHLDMSELDRVVNAEPFDSSSALDITIKDKNSRQLTLENISISSLRASTPYLKAHPEQLEANLKLLQALGSEERVGRVILEEDGITLKGHHGRFGEVKFLAPLDGNVDVEALTESIQTHLDFLMKVGAVPGVHSTTRDVGEAFGEEAPDDSEGHSNAEPRTYVTLGKKHNLLMEVKRELFECVADRMGVDMSSFPAQLAGGGLVHYDAKDGVYLIEGTVENFREINMPLRDASWLLHRLNNLPGGFSQDTELSGTEVTLHFHDGVPMETLQILTQSHVAFTARKTSITVPLTMMMNDPFHWSQEIGNQKDAVLNNSRRAKPEPAPEYLTVLNNALLDDAINDFESGRDGKVWICDDRHKDLPFDRHNPVIATDKQGRLDLEESGILTIPSIGKVNDAGLRYELSKLGGMERVGAPRVSMRLDRVSLAAPTIEPLIDTAYSKELRGLAEHMQSIHISPLLDELREVVDSDDMAIAHHDNDALYLQQAGRLADWIESHEELFDKLNGELNTILDKELEYRFEEGVHRIFNDVADLLLLEHTLKKQAEAGKLPISAEEAKSVITAVRDYADELEKLEFKRERVRTGCIDVQKRMMGFSEGAASRTESVVKAVASYHMTQINLDPDNAQSHEETAAKWLSKIYPTDPNRFPDAQNMPPKELEAAVNKNQAKINELIEKGKEESPYQELQLVQQLSGSIDKLWSEGRQFNRSLVFSRELIDGAVGLDNTDKLAKVRQASQIVHDTAAANALGTLLVLQSEGGVKDVKQGKDGTITFDASPMLKNPQRWATRLSELNKGKKPRPEIPYVAYDTSTLLSLLLSNEELPGKSDAGLLEMVKDLADLKVETPVITDMVLAELLYSNAPLSVHDLFAFDENGKATDIIYSPERMTRSENGEDVLYPKAKERLEFLRDLYNTGNSVFVETRTGREYLDAVRHSSELQATLAANAPEGTKPLIHRSDAELKTLLLDVESRAYPSFNRKLKSLRLRNDSGEVSIADAITHLRDVHGMELPVYVRYEGTDVRGRIIQRINEPDRGYNAQVDKQYDPYNSRDNDGKHAANFNRKTLKALGNGGFQSTGGFFTAMAALLNESGAYINEPGEIARNFDADGKLQWVPRDETGNYPEGSLPTAYANTLQQVSNGLGAMRRYNAIKDVRFGDTEYNVKGEHQLTTGKPSPLFDHLHSQPQPVKSALTLRHMDRLAEYLDKLAGKWEDRARKARENVGRVQVSIDHITQTLQQSEAKGANKPEADEKERTASFVERVGGGNQPAEKATSWVEQAGRAAGAAREQTR
jgi:single-stranded-DNA-specific exonuclease